MVHLILVGSAFLVLGRIMVWMLRHDSLEASGLAVLWLVMMFWLPGWLCAVTFLYCLAWAVPGLEQAMWQRCQSLLARESDEATSKLQQEVTA